MTPNGVTHGHGHHHGLTTLTHFVCLATALLLQYHSISDRSPQLLITFNDYYKTNKGLI